jgi:hypothetical protein
MNKLKETTKTIPKGTTVMIIDEFGDLGVTPKDPAKKRRYKHFGYAVSITDKPRKFAHLTENNRRIRVKELKASQDSPDGRVAVAKGMSDMGVDVRVYYIDKDNPPRGWSGKKGSSQDMGKLFRRSVKESLPEKGNVLVIVDSHTGHRNIDSFLEEQSKDGLKVRGGQYNSESGLFSDLLQTQDYAAYAARDAVEYRNRKLSDIVHIKFRKIIRRL